MWTLVFDFGIDYTPVPKGRPKFRIVNMKNKKPFGVAYTPAKTRKAEEDLKTLVWEKISKEKPIDVAIRLELIMFLPRPKAHYGTGRNEGKLKASAPPFPDKKPDIDNLEKLFLDAAEGLLWKNDSRIVQKTTLLWYADYRAPGYVVKAWKLEEQDAFIRKLRNLDPPEKGSKEDILEHHEDVRGENLWDKETI